MQCELCGNDFHDCRPAVVDGVRMMLCPGCMKYGEAVKEVARVPVGAPTGVKRSILERIKRPRVKDVYKDMDKELVSDWNEVIKEARKKKGLTREELGFNIGERTVTIAKIENGDLRPSDKIVAKLEKKLGVTLFEEVKSVSIGSGGSRSDGLTLGDFIRENSSKYG